MWDRGRVQHLADNAERRRIGVGVQELRADMEGRCRPGSREDCASFMQGGGGGGAGGGAPQLDLGAELRPPAGRGFPSAGGV